MAAPDDTRSLTVKQIEQDLKALADNKYNLQVAKSVIKNGQRGCFPPVITVKKGNKLNLKAVSFNMVWQSRVLAPSVNIKWKPVYGLNWSADVPVPGLTVTLGGEWKQCDQGQVLDLSQYGVFDQSTSTPKIGSLKVGKNNYKTGTGSGGVHFIVGVQEANGAFSPIFVDPTETGYGMEAMYQPVEKVQWWYQAGMQTSTMISENIGPAELGDFSKPDDTSGLYAKTSSYAFKESTWKTASP